MQPAKPVSSQVSYSQRVCFLLRSLAYLLRIIDHLFGNYRFLSLRQGLLWDLLSAPFGLMTF